MAQLVWTGRDTDAIANPDGCGYANGDRASTSSNLYADTTANTYIDAGARPQAVERRCAVVPAAASRGRPVLS